MAMLLSVLVPMGTLPFACTRSNIPRDLKVCFPLLKKVRPLIV